MGMFDAGWAQRAARPTNGIGPAVRQAVLHHLADGLSMTRAAARVGCGDITVAKILRNESGAFFRSTAESREHGESDIREVDDPVLQFAHVMLENRGDDGVSGDYIRDGIDDDLPLPSFAVTPAGVLASEVAGESQWQSDDRTRRFVAACDVLDAWLAAFRARCGWAPPPGPKMNRRWLAPSSGGSVSSEAARRAALARHARNRQQEAA